MGNVLPKVTFLGVGDATHPDGATTSVLYTGKRSILVDCGPAIAHRYYQLSADAEALDAIWITHQHADHCFGLPTLLLTLRLAGRKKPLELMGGPGSSKYLLALLELGYPGSFNKERCFPITFTEVEPDRPIERLTMKFTTTRTQHRVACFALRIDEGGCAVCVSGDGKVTPESLRLYLGADLVVQECQWATRTSYEHSCVADLRPLIEQANVRRIALVHRSGKDEAAIAEFSRDLLGERSWLPIAGESYQVSSSDATTVEQ